MEYEKELQQEFHAEEGSFLLQLRIDLVWDHPRLIEVLKLMETCCVDMQQNSSLPRNLADGFWYFSTFVESWSSHSNFPKTFSEAYYEKAYGFLFKMADWFFCGSFPWNTKDGFDRELLQLNKLST